MKNNIFKQISIPSFVILSFMFSACERKIDFDLGKGEPQVVVDAFLNNSRDTQFIYISKSVPYLDNNDPIGYDVDSIIVLDQTILKPYKFNRIALGTYAYVPNNDTLLLGHQFYLAVFDKANTYVSATKMGRVGTIDTMVYERESPNNPQNVAYNVEFKGKDPVGVGDLVWIKEYKNDTLREDFNVAYDNAFTASDNGNGDGELYIVPLRTFGGYFFGDYCKVEIYAISPECYYYLKQIDVQLNNTAGLFAQPVANVDGNIINLNNDKDKILGFFNVGAVVRKSVRVL